MNILSQKISIITFASLCSIILGACEQTTAPQAAQNLPVERYQQAEKFLPSNLGDLVLGEFVAPNWEEDGNAFWFVAEGRDSNEYVLVDPENGERETLADTQTLLTALTALDESTDQDETPRNPDYDFETSTLTFRHGGKQWAYDTTSGELAERDREDEVRGLSPDGRWRVFVEDHDLYIEDTESGEQRRLTDDGTAEQPYARPVVNLRRMIAAQTSAPELDADISWAPDSSRFATYRMDLREARRLSVVQSTPPDDLPPINYEYVYSLTGDTEVPTASSIVFEAESGERIDVDLPPQAILYYYGPNALWATDSSVFVQAYPTRNYDALRLYVTDASSGAMRVLTENSSDTFVDYYRHSWSYLEDSDSYFWLSEESGWHHGYLVTRDGERQQLTDGDWRALYLAGSDAEDEQLFIVGSGREAGRDPYLRHLYRVPRDGGEAVLLTPEPLDHGVSVSPDGRYFVDNQSAINQPTRSVLRSAENGDILMELQTADISALEAEGYRLPEPFETVAADGVTPIYGAVYLPPDLDPEASYPVIENIYTGPHYVMTPKSFGAALTGRNAASIAALGFVVVTIDGRGTSGRSREFLAEAYRNLHNVGLDDHIAGIRAMAEKYPFMDLERVGIYGFSAGGYDVVRAMTRRPDFYKAGVSASGNHDNRLDKAIWNEQWMGFPLDDNYDENSNVKWADKLEGDLFLAHGELDENVPPLATRRLIDALIQANKDFEYLIVPNAAHFLDSSDYFNRRRWDFFVRSLLDVEPPADYLIGGEFRAD